MGDDYTPALSILAMHNVPRITGVNTYALNDQQYLNGLYFIVVPYFIMALVCLCTFPCSVFLRNVFPKTHQQQKVISRLERRRQFEYRRFVYVIVWFITTIGAIVALLGNEVAESGFNRSLELMQEQISLLSDARDDVYTTQDGAVLVQGELVVTEASCTSVDFSAIDEDLDALQTGVDDWNDALGGTLEYLEELYLSSLNSRYDYTSSFMALVLTLFVLSMLSLVFINTRCACHPVVIKVGLMTGSVLIPLSIIALVAMWCITGISMALAVGSSDFCIDPDLNIQGVTLLADDPQVYNVTYYYTTCTVYPGAPEGLDTLADGLVELGEGLLSNLDAARLEVEDSCSDSLEEVDNMLDQIDEFTRLLISLSQDISCTDNMNGIYLDMRHHICDRWTVGLIISWSGNILLVIFLFMTAVASPDGDQRKSEAAIQIV